MTLRILSLFIMVALMASSPAHGKEAVYQVIEVERVVNPEDVSLEPVTYYVVNAGKNQDVKAGDLFRVERFIDADIPYILYIGDIQALESYENMSKARLVKLAEPDAFPVPENYTVMKGDRATPFSPPEEIVSVEPKPPSPKGKEKVIRVIEVNDRVLFELGKSDLRPEAREKLKEVSKKIKEFAGKVRVEGHTCDLGPDAFNLALSKKRANAVMEFLMTEGGIPADKLTAEGLGEKFLLYKGKTEEERAKNRRVEFKFLGE